MTINPFIIYLWGIADNAISAAIIIAVFAGLASVFLSIGFGIAQSDEDDALQSAIRPWLRGMLPAFVLTLLASVLIPSSKTIAVMVIVPAIVNSSVIQKDVPELYNMAIGALKESLTGSSK